MNNLLKEAIADAKAVRETALANAKLALEEAFTPRLQSMLSAKLSEEEGMEDEVAEDEMPMDEPVMDEPAVEEPAVEEPAPAEEGMRGMNDADEDPTDVHSEELADEEPVAEEDDLELEAILRELEDEGEAEEVTENEDEEDTVDEVSGSTKIGTGDNKMDVAYGKDQEDPGKGDLMKGVGMTENEGEGEDVDLEEIINALREEDEAETTDEGQRGDKEVDEAEDSKEDLEEAYKVIKFMQSKLNEVNLLNAKLLFSNKLFRNHSLNESQKMKVIENFDRAQSLREVKLVFATLSESFKLSGGTSKKTIKESYASRPTRTTKPTKSVLSEGSVLANRWKKLAGLNG